MISKTEVKDVQDQNYYYLLALLTSMPFHHLISAQKIYSSISAKAKQSNTPVNIPSIYVSPNERLKLFQNAATSGKPFSQSENHLSKFESDDQFVLLNRFIELGFIDTAPSGEKFQLNWQVIFNDELQGCAEIYRAEMLLFKRMIYEQKEEPKSILKLSNGSFSKNLDYELFNFLTGNETEKLLLENLSTKYKISLTTVNEESDKNNGFISKKIRRNSRKRKLEKFPFNSEENLSILVGRLRGWESYPAGDFRTNSDEICESTNNSDGERLGKNFESILSSNHVFDIGGKLLIYELKLGAYWAKWRQAARLARFDFDLLESLDNPHSIRFYELTKFLRLASYSETEQFLSTKLEVGYESLASLMPLPKLKTKEEIKTQINNLIIPLKKASHLKLISYRSCGKNQKDIIIIFEFENSF